MSQSNTRIGDITLAGNADLEGKEGYLAKIVSDSGVPEAALPSAQNDMALYVIIDGGVDSGDRVQIRPLDPERNVRVKLNGTCAPGTALVLDVGAAEDYGKVKALPSTGGPYLQVGFAEETGADEQLVLMRPSIQRRIVAGSHLADLATDYADDGGAKDLDTDAKRVAAMNATNTKVNAILAALETAGILATS